MHCTLFSYPIFACKFYTARTPDSLNFNVIACDSFSYCVRGKFIMIHYYCCGNYYNPIIFGEIVFFFCFLQTDCFLLFSRICFGGYTFNNKIYYFRWWWSFTVTDFMFNSHILAHFHTLLLLSYIHIGWVQLIRCLSFHNTCDCVSDKRRQYYDWCPSELNHRRCFLHDTL